MSHTFVLASHNAHKVAEFQHILGAGDSGLEILSYDGPEPIESGASFAENALIKARAAAEHTGLPALADDSGLCVDVMNGAPGIFSARWAGSRKSDATNLELLLEQLGDVPDEHRGAYYACVIALVIPADPETGGATGAATGAAAEEFVVEGRWRGHLAREPRGTNGFGYDPIFVPTGMSVSAAELEPAIKNAQSHRAIALAELQKILAVRS